MSAGAANTIIRFLTGATLFGLLFSSGLRLTWSAIRSSLHQNRLGWILPVNFVLVPLVAFAAARVLHLSNDVAAGMALLAAAPFAPVVPTFARLAKADLALASALTGLFPFVSAFATPLVCELSLRPWLEGSSLHFNMLSILLTLVLTITLPLTVGLLLRHWKPALAQRLTRPVEIVSEITGALALLVVTVMQFQTICSLGGKALLAMVITAELAFLSGYGLSGPSASARMVVGLGSAARNIALAILLAIASFPQTPIVAAVVANGLLSILLCLAHVGLWRLTRGRANQSA